MPGNVDEGKCPFLAFNDAWVYVRSLRLKTQKAWHAWSLSVERLTTFSNSIFYPE